MTDVSATISPMTKQEAAQRIWDHFIVNEAPPSYAGGVCFYRAPDGARCAVGVLIPDELYRDEMEGVSAQELLSGFAEIGRHLEGAGWDFLYDCQIIHDHWAELKAKDRGWLRQQLRSCFAAYDIAIDEDRND